MFDAIKSYYIQHKNSRALTIDIRNHFRMLTITIGDSLSKLWSQFWNSFVCVFRWARKTGMQRTTIGLLSVWRNWQHVYYIYGKFSW